MGDPIYDELRPVLPAIEPVKLTNLSKAQLIQSLMVSIERQRIRWPRTWSTLTDELKRYEYRITAQGNITYNAPAGYHDDCVIALALANSKLSVVSRPPCGPVAFSEWKRGIEGRSLRGVQSRLRG